jgi:hypothetical protein
MNENIVKSFVDAVKNNDSIVSSIQNIQIRLFGKGMLHFHNRERTWGIWVEHFSSPVRYKITVSTFRYEGATQYTVNTEIYHEVLEHDAALNTVTSTIIDLEA